MDEDIKMVLADVKYEFLSLDEALAKIKALTKKDIEKVLEWGCAQGYKIPEGIGYRIEIEGKVYSIPEAIEIYLKR